MGCGPSQVLSDDPDIDEITVADSEKGYRPPKPPKWKKRDVFNKEDVKGIDKRASQVRITTETTFSELVSELTQGLNTDLKKLRALFMWVGHQDFENDYYPGVTNGRSPRGYLKLMKLGKGTYYHLFALLCRAAKIPCVIVRGNCKSVGYDVGDQDVSGLIVNWNAVYVDGAWQIVHPMWAFTGVVGHDSGRWTKIETGGKGTRERATARAGVSIRDIDEDYFLPHPEEFLYHCIAEKKEWQLVDEPWDLHKFCNVPRFEFSYFVSDFKLKAPHEAIIHSEGGKCVLEFDEKKNTIFNLAYELFFDEQQSKESLPPNVELPRCVFFETEGKNLRLVVRCHVAGIYKMTIKCGLFGLNIPIASFRLEANEKAENENLLPVNPLIGFGFGHTAHNNGLTGPSHRSGVVVTKRNTTEEFTFKMTRVSPVFARLRHNKLESEQLDQYLSQEVKGTDVKVKVRMPEAEDDGEYALQIYTGEETGENNVLNYLLTSRKEDFEKIQEDVLRKNLSNALSNHKLEELEKAIADFEGAKLKDTGDLKRAKAKIKKLKKEQLKQEEITALKRGLNKAMRGRSLVELEKSIAECEGSGHSELDNLLTRARAVVAELDQEAIQEETDSDVRGELISATKARDREGLERSVRMFQNSRLSDQGDLTSARSTLSQLYEEAAERDVSGHDIEALEHLLENVETSIVEDDLQNSEVIRKAQRFLQQQKRLRGFLSPVLDMKKATIAEIQNYNKPNTVTQDVMRATLITLGEHPNNLQTWLQVQKYLKPGHVILRKIKQFRMDSLRSRTVDRANQLLEKYTTDDVREVSAGVAAFFEWSTHILQEKQNGDHS